MTRRIIYLLCAAATICLGLASRQYRKHLPSFIGEYSGDVLWALMLFLAVSFVLAGRSLCQRFIISLILAFSVEVSQLYHSPWIDDIRSTTLGGLVLGFGFLWRDLVCYSVGIALGLVFESAIAARIQRTKEAQQ